MQGVLYCTVLYCTVLYCTVLYCTVLYCTVLYCTVLYCTVLYCTVLYCTVLYCTSRPYIIRQCQRITGFACRRNVLKMNGYPQHFIDNAMKTPQSIQQKIEYQSSVCLPYIGPASHKIERILKNEAGIKVYHSSENKLFRALCTHCIPCELWSL